MHYIDYESLMWLVMGNDNMIGLYSNYEYYALQLSYVPPCKKPFISYIVPISKSFTYVGHHFIFQSV